MKSSTKRATGERDERGEYTPRSQTGANDITCYFAGPLEKFLAYLEDIFEAEDALSPDADPKGLSEDFFSRHTTDCAHPLLNVRVMEKLMKYITKCARPMGHSKMSGREDGAAGGKGRMADVKMATLVRLLKILERSVKMGHDVDPFETASMPPSDTVHSSPKKRQAKDGQPRGETPKSFDDQVAGPSVNVSDPDDQSDVNFAALEKCLDAARDSIIAANCCISLLSSDRLPKQVSSSVFQRIHANSSCVALLRGTHQLVLHRGEEPAGHGGLPIRREHGRAAVTIAAICHSALFPWQQLPSSACRTLPGIGGRHPPHQ